MPDPLDGLDFEAANEPTSPTPAPAAAPAAAAAAAPPAGEAAPAAPAAGADEADAAASEGAAAGDATTAEEGDQANAAGAAADEANAAAEAAELDAGEAAGGAAAPAAPAAQQQQQPPAQQQQQHQAPPVDPTVARAQRMDAILRDLKPLKAQLDAVKDEELNPYEHGVLAKRVASLSAELGELQQQALGDLQRAEQERQQARHAEAQWADWARKNPDIGAKGREIFEEEVHKAYREQLALDPNEDPAVLDKIVQRLATREWQRRITLSRGHKQSAVRQPARVAAPPPRPTGPAGKGAPAAAGATLPRQGAGGPIPPKPLSDEEWLAREVGDGINSFMS